MRSCKSIGISGGTFDPIHFGHLITAEWVREQFALDTILFIPSGTPPHKKNSGVSTAEHRYNMVCGAVSGNAHFEVSRMEIERPGYTYTVDTLKQLKDYYGQDTTLYFIIGADVVGDLLTWKDPQGVFALCEFIAVFRPGGQKEKFLEQIDFLRTSYGVKIHTLDVPMIEISSTAIRQRVKANLSVKYLLPESVETYIIQNRLYSGGI